MAFLTIIIKYYTFDKLLVSMIPQISHIIGSYLVTISGLVTTTFICIISIIMFQLIKQINDKYLYKSENDTTFNTYKAYKMTETFIVEHNNYCEKFKRYNMFWSQIYFAYIIAIIPINLMNLYQFLFENLIIQFRILFVFLLIITVFLFFVLQYIYAYISYQIHKPCIRLSQLQWRINGYPFRMRFKLKLMAYFERLSSDRKIGPTLGPTITLTFPVFYQVQYAIYLYFLLL